MIICLTSLYPENEENKCAPIFIADKKLFKRSHFFNQKWR